MTRFEAAAWLTAPSTLAVLDALEAAGGAGCVRVVGGAVRNALMGRPVEDVDLATTLWPDQVIAALSERYYRSISFAVDDIKFAAARCRTAAQFADVLQEAVESFGTAEGIHRRQLRVEALGAAVSRPVLQASLIEANRRQAELFGEVLQIAREEGWLRVDVDPLDLAAWWTGLMLSRHLIEIDSTNFDPDIWTQISSWTVGQMISEPDGSQ